MIKTQYQVPSVYYDKSRDFQLLGRTLDVVLNYLRTNINAMSNSPLSNSYDKKVLDLLATTVGLQQRHSYDNNSLFTICSSFSNLLKNKGSIKSIEEAVNCLLHAQGIYENCYIEHDRDDYYLLNIHITKQVEDLSILEDLMNYILPAGMTYQLIKVTFADILKENISKQSDEYNLTNLPSVGPEESVGEVPKYSSSGTDKNKTLGLNEIKDGTIDNIVVAPKIEEEETDNG